MRVHRLPAFLPPRSEGGKKKPSLTLGEGLAVALEPLEESALSRATGLLWRRGSEAGWARARGASVFVAKRHRWPPFRCLGAAASS